MPRPSLIENVSRSPGRADRHEGHGVKQVAEREGGIHNVNDASELS
jgi:hypothetical protein